MSHVSLATQGIPRVVHSFIGSSVVSSSSDGLRTALGTAITVTRDAKKEVDRIKEVNMIVQYEKLLNSLELRGEIHFIYNSLSDYIGMIKP
jgi:hypothetical protein